MLEILSITGPIYLAMAAGYLSVRLGLFGVADVRVMGTFVVNIALPCLLFATLSHRAIADVVNPTYLAAYGLSILVTAGLGMVWARRVRGMAAARGIIVAMGMSCPNSGFVGFPVMLLTLPAVAPQVLAMNLVIENLLTLPLLMALADQAAGVGAPWHRTLLQILGRLVRNPLVIGLVAAVAMSASGLPVPAVLDRTVTLFAQVSGGLSLFAIGASLGGSRRAGEAPRIGLGRRLAEIAPITLVKLVLHPLVTVVVLVLLALVGLPPMTPELRTAVILSTAMPMLSIYPILALRYGHEDLASLAVAVTTLATAVTLTVLLWAVQHHLPVLTEG